MNEDNAKEIMRKVLQADRIIHEQQLGIDWTPPAEDLFKNVDPLFFHRQNTMIPTTISDAENVYENEMGGKLETKQQDDLKESLASKFQDHKNNSKTMKLTLELLCNEAGFLVEDKLQKLLEPLHRDEQSLMRLDSIFKALGVETVEDIERLTSHFVNEISISSQDLHKSRSQLIIEDNCKLIHPDDVLLAIRSFVEKSHERATISQDISIAEETKESEREMRGI
jgi:dynein regulatory complex protein 1